MEFSKQLNKRKPACQAGQSLTEYGLVIALVGVVSIAGLNMLGNSISSQLSGLANALGSAGGGNIAVAASPAPSMPAPTPSAPSTPTSAAPASNPGGTANPPANTQAMQPATNSPTPANTTAPSTTATAPDSQQGATLICSGNDPSCGGNVEVGLQNGW